MTVWNESAAGIFAATYLLDLALHFYYLKNSHLSRLPPRIALTVARAACLIGLFRG